MRKHRRLVCGLIATVLVAAGSLSGSTQAADAATGNKGYAVYRDGVFFGYTWHAGLMRVAHKGSSDKPLIMAPGGEKNVIRDTWSHFLDGNSYKGTYRPKRAPNSAQRDLFVYTAQQLVDDKIPYSLYYQLNYPVNDVGYYVEPSEIKGIRCDGVIEYVFEWYSFHVYGGATYWDITKASSTRKDFHSGIQITPKSQAKSYLTLVTNSAP